MMWQFLKQLIKKNIIRLAKLNVIYSEKEFNQQFIKEKTNILYVLPFDSSFDIQVLEKACKQEGVPSIYNPLVNYISLKDNKYNFINNQQIIDLYLNDKTKDLQIITVLPLWYRLEKYKKNVPFVNYLTGTKKIVSFIRYYRNITIKFSKPISLNKLLEKHHQQDNSFNYKVLTRLISIYFVRQKLITCGPRFPKQDDVIHSVLNSTSIQTVIETESNNKNINKQEVTNNAKNILLEMATKWGITTLLITNKFLAWLWHRLYRKINVYNIDNIKDSPLNIYVPCHRSHMDYILLSYVLYNNGLSLPHIAAGVNLNFWPAGLLFRKGGAFFIRRKIGTGQLYPSLLKQYVTEILSRDFSVEFFIEGGRTRTGLLLPPKTGLLSMIMHAALNHNQRGFNIVPIYIGYEKVIEADTYFKELQGSKKEKENAFLVLKMLKKLKNMGETNVSFGQPIAIDQFIKQNYPELREYDNPEVNKQISLLTNDVAELIMININKAATVNSANLLITTLFSFPEYKANRDNLIKQLDLYKHLLLKTEYSKDLIIINEDSNSIINNVLSLKGTGIIKEKIEQSEMIILPQDVAMVSSFYSNNIIHLFIIPALVAKIIYVTNKNNIFKKAKLFQLIKAHLNIFISAYSIKFTEQEFVDYFNNLINVLLEQQIISSQDNEKYQIIKFDELEKLSRLINNNLLIYYIVLLNCNLKLSNPKLNIEKTSEAVVKKFLEQAKIIVPDFYSSKTTITTFMKKIKSENYFDAENNILSDKLMQLLELIEDCIEPSKKEQTKQFIESLI